MTKRCIGFIWSHAYEARYDELPPVVRLELDGFLKPSSINEILRLYRTKTYVRDVCTRCGHVIERQK